MITKHENFGANSTVLCTEGAAFPPGQLPCNGLGAIPARHVHAQCVQARRVPQHGAQLRHGLQRGWSHTVVHVRLTRQGAHK